LINPVSALISDSPRGSAVIVTHAAPVPTHLICEAHSVYSTLFLV
jgi:hypothetical protein